MSKSRKLVKREVEVNNEVTFEIIEEIEMKHLNVYDEAEDIDGEEELIENEDGTMTIKIPEKRKTSNRVEHSCPKCSKNYDSLAELKRHINICRNMPKDTLVTRDEDDFAIIDVNDRKYKKICFCCNEEKSTAHYGHVKCNFCPKSFKSHGNLERHLFLLHSTTETRFACSHCNAKCVSDPILQAHLESHETGKPFSCKRCGKDFTRKYHLDRHTQYTDCDQSRSKKEIPCHVCGKMFSRTDNLREHLRVHIGQSTRKRDYQCPHCEKCFYGSSLLNIHIRTHTGEKPFDCDLCEKSFPSNGALRKHRRSHTGEKPYICKTCGKCFSAKETLNRHVKVHTGERPHACPHCDKKFIQSTQLRSHLFNHTGENGFNCELCNMKFNRKTRLEQHIKNDHMNEGKHSCDECDQKFAKKTDLKKHKLTHADGNMFICDICSKPFKTKQSLLTHLRRHSANECQECSKRFNDGAALKLHMDKMHGTSTANTNTFDIELVTTDPSSDTYKIICATNDDPKMEKSLMASDFEILVDNYEQPKELIAMNENELKENVAELLKIVVEEDILTKHGYPDETIENILVHVLLECDQKPIDISSCSDVGTKLRENVKLLFTTVIDDESIKEMLNNHTVDEVIRHVINVAKA